MQSTTFLFERTYKKLFKAVSPNIKFNKKELRVGIKTELEHTTDRKVAEIIAKQHLAEDPEYYTKLKKIHDEDENTVGGGVLGPEAATGHNDMYSTDWYAKGDYRRPQALGAVQTRNGLIKKKKKKKNK